MNNISVYLSNKQGELFVLAQEKNYNPIDFISLFMKSELARSLDNDYSYWQLQPIESWLEIIVLNHHLKKIPIKKTYNLETLRWLGYFYRTWHFITGEPSYKIIRYLNPKEGVESHYAMHQLAYEQAIEIIKNRYNYSRNAHRKYEIKKSSVKQEKNNIYDNPIYYQYLARRMLYKLNNDEAVKTSVKKFNDAKFDFISKNNRFGIKGDVIFKTDKSNTIESKFEMLKTASSHKVLNSIYFCFIFSLKYELLSDEDIDLVIKKFRDEHINRNYDYVYFYLLGRLIEINPSNEIHSFYLPFSKKEREGIKNEIKRDELYEEIENAINQATNL